jgi:hypothetical protein
MKLVAKAASPAAIAVLRQATALFPKRKKLSDGLLPSLAHQKANPNSDHNTGLAVDLTHDPKNGIDCAIIFEKLKEDERVNYLIYNKTIWSREKSKQGNRPYVGLNPHIKHIHISINADKANDISPWFWWLNQAKISNQILAKIQTIPKKQVYNDVPTCTCCPIHGKQGKDKNGNTKANIINMV